MDKISTVNAIYDAIYVQSNFLATNGWACLLASFTDKSLTVQCKINHLFLE